jgi:hypothetical protein
VPGVAVHQPLKAVVDADDSVGAVTRFQGERADDTVDARRGSTADQDTYVLIFAVLSYKF